MHRRDRHTQRPAKLSCPVLPEIVPRVRLIDQLERAAGTHATWIAGPPGAGKTTLAASYAERSGRPLIWYQVTADDADPATFFAYLARAVAGDRPSRTSRLPLLTPEYSLGHDAYTRTFVEAMRRCLGDASRLFVLDNMQEAGEESPLVRVLPIFLEAVPAAWQVVFASRTAPPPAFARLQANRRLMVIDGTDLRFSMEESQQVARLLAGDDLDPAIRDRMIARADGWAAGLVLLVWSGAGRPVPADPGSDAAPDLLFDYFATQVYGSLPDDRRAFLERSALLPVITTAGAQSLARERRAGEFLADLAGRGCFTTRHREASDRYELHPLFRDFLRRRLDAGITSDERRLLLTEAASLAEAEDDLDTAVHHLAHIEDWNELAALLGRHGQRLLTAGRHGTLGRWLDAVPDTVDRACPWLGYWRGLAVMFTAPDLARRRLTQAFRAFEGDIGARYTIATAINIHFITAQEFRHATEWLDEACALLQTTAARGRFEPPAAFTASLAVLMCAAQPGRDEYPALEQQLRRFVALDTSPPDLRVLFAAALGHRLTWGGGGWDTATASRLESLHAIVVDGHLDGVPRFIWLLFAIQIWYWYDVLIGRETAVTDLLAALDQADRQGIRVFAANHHFCYLQLHLSTGDSRAIAARIDALRRSSLGSHDRTFAFFAEAWAAATAGRLTEALALAEACTQAARETREPAAHVYAGFARAQLLSLLGRAGDARRVAAGARRYARRARAHGLEFCWWLVAAVAALEQGRHARCVRLTSEVFARMARERYVRFPFLLRAPMSRLCAIALENGIEVGHVRRVIRASSLEAPNAACQNWPWPVRISCFGSLRIELDGRPFEFGRKAPRRLLDLLGLIIASGGTAVPESTLIDALWTDADGDAAHNDLSVALHRLRKLFGPDALAVDNGLVTLDPRHVWTDVRAFQRLLHAGGGTRMEGTEPVPAPIGQALCLYRGPFLAGDDRCPWTLAARWHLHEQYLGAVGLAGAGHERAGRWLDALSLYTRALSIDPQSERLYQALFRCHAALGMRAEAAAAWTQCKAAVGELGLVPSARTEALYRAAVFASPDE